LEDVFKASADGFAGDGFGEGIDVGECGGEVIGGGGDVGLGEPLEEGEEIGAGGVVGIGGNEGGQVEVLVEGEIEELTV
jgi:hypothetical protein